MAEPFLSEIRLFTFDFAPKGWAMCNGQFLPINQNQALFSLLGTTYGGNGQTTFALPDLRGRVAQHEGAGFVLGERGGEEAHTLAISELPTHSHFARANDMDGVAGVAGITPGATKSVARALVSLQGGGTTPAQLYGSGAPDRAMHPSTIANVGGSQPHLNMHPYLTMNFCIALQGIFPSPN